MHEIRNALRGLDYTDLRMICRAHDIKRDDLEDFIDGVADMPHALHDWYKARRLQLALAKEDIGRVADVTGVNAQRLSDFVQGTAALDDDEIQNVKHYMNGDFSWVDEQWKLTPLPRGKTQQVTVVAAELPGGHLDYPKGKKGIDPHTGKENKK